MLTYERECWQQGRRCVAGVDEAGRGPLAGPVVAAAVVFDPDFAERERGGVLAGLTDSKKLSPSRREHFCAVLFGCDRVRIGIGECSAGEIDAMNILRATHRAMVLAVRDLAGQPDLALIDGRPIEGLSCPSRAIVGGDGLSLSVAAGSVVAKVVRDDRMRVIDTLYPRYGFAAHKGYGTSRHLQALFEFGPCPEHRRSFRPVREAEAIWARSRCERSGP